MIFLPVYAPNQRAIAFFLYQSAWIDDRRKTQSPAPSLDPVAFKAIKIQFRKGSLLDSTITALALTQTISVPESSPAIAVLSVLGFGLLCGRRSRSERPRLEKPGLPLTS